ncbi:hypothetical protein DL765_001562 [Monosporascus sp. GIB2]|nr:hypothetical protein DL765_001562 [Monosporascus sp. GIB2]
MDKLSPEIIHIIASLLSVDDLLNFRLASRSFADVGAAYLLPEVTFYAHEEELERLRAISLHPIFSRNVKSLLYIGDAQMFPPPSFQDFVEWAREYNVISERDNLSPNLSLSRLVTEYKQVEAVASNQHHVLTSRLDVACLEEVLPRLTSLRMATMSGDSKFQEDWYATPRPSPFNSTVREPYLVAQDYPGGRQLEALALAIASTGCTIEHLRAGTFSWKFFQKDPAELKRMFTPFSNLRGIELDISFYFDGLELKNFRGEAKQLQALLGTGIIRDILSSMPHLQLMSVNASYSYRPEVVGSMAPLSPCFQPGYQWRDLQKLELRRIRCPRQELMSILELHRKTLREICLSRVDLKQTSWRELLPWIRKTLYLHDACICGHLSGTPEDDTNPDASPPDREYFGAFLTESGPSEVASSINMYCRRGGECYPDEIPLDYNILQKHYDRGVLLGVVWRIPKGNEDDDEFEGSLEDVESSDNGDEDGEDGLSDNDLEQWFEKELLDSVFEHR